MSDLGARVFECEGHEFVQLRADAPGHLDDTCRRCRARRKALEQIAQVAEHDLDLDPRGGLPFHRIDCRACLASSHSSRRRFVCEGHEYEEWGGSVLHPGKCAACQRGLHTEAARVRQREAATALSLAAERIADGISAGVMLAIAAGFLTLVGWLAITDPVGLLGTVAGVFLTPLANVLCVLLRPFGGCY